MEVRLKGPALVKGLTIRSLMRCCILIFNELPKELFDKIVEIRVLNSKVLLLEFLIGSFKFDVGMAYDEPGHCYMYIH